MADPIDDDASGIELHPDRPDAAVAPSLIDDQKSFNLLRPSLAPIACWVLHDHRFAFASSFVLPEMRSDLQRLAAMYPDFEDSPVSLFGHADPVGDPASNKKLSGSRAKAIYALLTRKPELWEELYNEHGWGLASTQEILKFLDDEDAAEAADDSSDDAPDAEPPPRFDGPIDGKDGPKTKAAVKRFQQSERGQGLAADGVAGPKTRKRLYEVYMDALCSLPDGTPFKIEPDRFLGKAAHPKGKADYQGCSEFNPLMILSKELEKKFAAEHHLDVRNAANARNRRVVLYFFDPALTIDPAQWPCPRADEGTAGCEKRFWKDHKDRTAPAETKLKWYYKEHKTFACRFYDRLARSSPCEAGMHEYWLVQLVRPGAGPVEKRTRLHGATFVVTDESGTERARGSTPENGIIRLRVRGKPEKLKIELTIPPEPPAEGESGGDSDSGDSDEAEGPPLKTTITISGGALLKLKQKADDPEKDAKELSAVIGRLRNLGYGPADPARWKDDPHTLKDALAAFRKDYELGDADGVDDVTRDKLHEVHGS